MLASPSQGHTAAASGRSSANLCPHHRAFSSSHRHAGASSRRHPGARLAQPSRRQTVRVAAMRAVIQRVKSASVEVEGSIVSRIGQGWLCLVGLTNDDTDEDADFVLKKILKTRGWPDPETASPWAKDVAGIEGELLLVSQFTLFGRLKKPKPDFTKAMGPEQARAFYAAFVQKVRQSYVPNRVHDGVFGAMMDVALVNDGPVTFIIDSGHQGAGHH